MVKSGKSFPPQHCHLCFTSPRSLTSFHFTIQNPFPKKRSKCCHFPIGSWAHQEAETTSCCPLSATLGVNTAWEQQGDKRKGNHPLTAPMADGTMNLSWKLQVPQKILQFTELSTFKLNWEEWHQQVEGGHHVRSEVLVDTGSSSWLPSAIEIWTCWSKSRRWLRASDKQREAEIAGTAQPGKEKAYQHV